MGKKLNAIMQWIDSNFLTILLGYIEVFIVILCMILYSMNHTIRLLETKLDIYETKRQQEVSYLEAVIGELATITAENDLTIYELNKKIVKAIRNIQDLQEIIQKDIKKRKTIDLSNIENIKKANILVVNMSQLVQGSGTHIKIKGNNYILSCAHLITEPDDFVWAYLDDGNLHPLEIVKLNKEKDLALFRIYNVDNLLALEISDIEPKEGSEVIVIGNPDGLYDVFTDGIIASIEKKGYLLSNLTYFGNSGGAVLYNGKIVGVISQLRVYYDIPVFVNYGFSSKLQMIKEFLGDISEEKSEILEN